MTNKTKIPFALGVAVTLALAAGGQLTGGGGLTRVVTTGATLTGSGTSASPLAVSLPAIPGRLIGIQRFSASGTYTPTTGTVTVIFEIQAGGGGGGGVATTGAGAGGNSGFYGRHHVTNGAGITGGAVTIGSGGAGGANTGATGGTGGDTSIVVNATTFTVKGGTGGQGVNNVSVAVQNPLVSASGSTAGMDVLRFGPGGDGVELASNNGASGAGGVSPLGSGGDPVNTSGGAGLAGTFGGGGSGACGSTAVGGAGGAGLVIINEYD